MHSPNGLAIYMLYNESIHHAYIWTVAERDDYSARMKAADGMLKGQRGRLFTGPTGVDAMDFMSVIIGRKKDDGESD
ncbi:hypothetical protein LCGC14_0317750 [marine sediment metagenome]|uniref:Uncharacterized protein n=1 Tax=marine sediment metagenome TaxID=412755 RepID=A0A0F9W768_9ZZZZ